MNLTFIGKSHQLDCINILNKDGTMNCEAGVYSGMKALACREQLWKDMQTHGIAINKEHLAGKLNYCPLCTVSTTTFVIIISNSYEGSAVAARR